MPRDGHVWSPPKFGLGFGPCFHRFSARFARLFRRLTPKSGTMQPLQSSSATGVKTLAQCWRNLGRCSSGFGVGAFCFRRACHYPVVLLRRSTKSGEENKIIDDMDVSRAMYNHSVVLFFAKVRDCSRLLLAVGAVMSSPASITAIRNGSQFVRVCFPTD
jgi:hypothetical protein